LVRGLAASSFWIFFGLALSVCFLGATATFFASILSARNLDPLLKEAVAEAFSTLLSVVSGRDVKLPTINKLIEMGLDKKVNLLWEFLGEKRTGKLSLSSIMLNPDMILSR